jgi:biotin carboxyl carrier protein
VKRDSTIEAIIKESATNSGEIFVCSPAVATYLNAPNVGEILVTGASAGRLTVLGRSQELVLPYPISGRVAERMLHNRRDPVDYGQPLLRLVPVETKELETDEAGGASTALDDLPQDCFAVRSPTHGMFYRRPSPDAPYYVEEGQIVEEGVTLALVEVMKCFSAITYGGEGIPPRAEIVEVRAEDASEVQSSQILFVLKPT